MTLSKKKNKLLLYAPNLGWRSCLARNPHAFNTPKKKTNMPIQYRNYYTEKIIWVQERGTCGTNWNYLLSWSLDGRRILCWSKDFSHSWNLKRRYCVHKMPSLVCSQKPPDPVCPRAFCMVMSDTLTLVTGYAVSGFVFSLSRLFVRWLFETSHFRLLSNPWPFSFLVLTILCHQHLETLRNWQSLVKYLGPTFCPSCRLYCSTLVWPTVFTQFFRDVPLRIRLFARRSRRRLFHVRLTMSLAALGRGVLRIFRFFSVSVIQQCSICIHSFFHIF